MDGIASAPGGNLYLADSTTHSIRLLRANGTLTNVAGDGSPGFSGDGGPAANARLNSPFGLAADAQGNLYVADFANARIRKISRDGRISTFAGGGALTSIPSAGVDPLLAKLSGPRNLTIDLYGDLYVTDAPANRVYRISAAGKLTLVAGEGTAVPLNFPAGLAADYLGNLYIADTGSLSIVKLNSGKAETLANTPALPGTPLALAADFFGRLTIATSEGGLYARNLDGLLSPLLTAPSFATLRALHQDPSGTLHFSEPARVWSLSGLGTLTLLAGPPAAAPAAPAVPAAPAAEARILAPMGIALDASANLYIADERALRLWRVTPSGTLQSAAGTGEAPASAATSGDGGPASSARLYDPVAVAVSPHGEIAIAEYAAHRVRVILPNGVIFTAAGTGAAGLAGDNGPAQFAQLNKPRGLAYDATGDLYIADSGNGRIRKLGRNGFLTTAGPGGLANPTSVAFDPAGALYVAESGAHSVRRLTSANNWETVAGTGAEGATADGLTARLSQFRFPTGLAFDSAGSLYLADAFNHRLRRISPAGLVETIAGSTSAGLSGDGGPALQAALNTPVALAFDASGRLFAADLENRRVRLLTPDAIAPPAQSTPPPQTTPPAQNTPPAPAGIPITLLHSATFKPGPFAPGQLVSLYGSGLLATDTIQANGQPAPVSFASASQINFQLPSLATATATIEVLRAGAAVARATIELAPSAPGLFASEGAVLAVSPGGALLSPGPGASRGSIVTLYATGAGLWDDAGHPRLPVSLRIGNSPAELLYSGQAPGLAGVLQLNVQLPGLFSPPGTHDVILTIGPNASPSGVTLRLN